MKIPIHKLFDVLGIKELEIDNPEDLEKIKQELDKLIEQEESKKQQKNQEKLEKKVFGIED